MIWLPSQLDSFLDTIETAGTLTITCADGRGAYRLRNALYNRKKRRKLSGIILKLQDCRVILLKEPDPIIRVQHGDINATD